MLNSLMKTLSIKKGEFISQYWKLIVLWGVYDLVIFIEDSSGLINHACLRTLFFYDYKWMQVLCRIRTIIIDFKIDIEYFYINKNMINIKVVANTI